MDKQTFLAELRDRLSGLPGEDVEERLLFYSEIIDDGMEDGLTEEEAVAGIGTVDEVMEHVMSEVSLPRLVKKKVKANRTLRIWEIILLVLGSPIWLSVLLAMFMIALSIYIVIWSAVTALWAVDLSMVLCMVCSFVTSGIFLFQGNFLPSLAIFGAVLASAGLAILLFFGCKYVTKGTMILTKRILIRVKMSFVGKKVAK